MVCSLLSQKNQITVATDVVVFIPTLMGVDEGDEMVQVCATLSTVEDTERNFTITLATSDGTGITVYAYYKKQKPKLDHCSYRWL